MREKRQGQFHKDGAYAEKSRTIFPEADRAATCVNATPKRDIHVL